MTDSSVSRRNFMQLVGAVGAASTAGRVEAGATNTPTEPSSFDPPIENQLVVTYTEGTDLAAAQAAAMRGVRTQAQRACFGLINESLRFCKVNLVGSLSSDERDAVKSAIKDQSAVDGVFEEGQIERNSSHYEPKDREYQEGKQVYLKNIGVSEAWNYTRGTDVRVNVIEEKVNVDLDELRPRFKEPYPGIVPGDSSERWVRAPNGLVGIRKSGFKDLRSERHATQVASVVAAQHNKKLIAGTSQAKLWNIALDSPKNTSLLTAIEFAIVGSTAKITITANSAGDNPEKYWETRIDELMSEAQKHDKLLIAATGTHDYEDSPNNVVRQPAKHPQVLAVAASDEDGKEHLGESGRGPETSLHAPGKRIRTVTDTGDTFSDNGTSFAAPIVAGIAAMTLKMHPHLSSAQLRRRLKLATVPTLEKYGNDEHDGKFGRGRIDAMKALFTLPDDTPIKTDELTEWGEENWDNKLTSTSQYATQDADKSLEDEESRELKGYREYIARLPS